MNEASSAELAGIGRVYFDPRSADEVAFLHREIFLDEEYGRHGIDVGPGDVVFDAGANIGLFALWADWKSGGGCTIFAFEPVPATFAMLERNLAEHGLGGERVRALPFGLTRIDGPRRASITVFPGLPGSSTLDPAGKQLELDQLAAKALAAAGESKFLRRRTERELEERFQRYEVECEFRLLAEVRREHGVTRIDLLKIDVEGAELDVVEGIDAETWPMISSVVLETAGEERARLLEAKLAGVGFANIVVERPAWAESYGLRNLNLYATR